MESKLCDTLFDRDDFKDVTGCLKPHAHFDNHVCRDENGNLIAWDYDWTCGCPDCRTDSFNDMCIVYRQIENIDDKF